MKIGIDARFWGQAGPGRYVKNLVLALEKIDSENEYVIFLNPGKGLEKSQTLYGVKSLTLGGETLEREGGGSKNFKFVEVDIPWYSFAEQIKLPSIFAREKLDLLHVPHFNIPIFYPGKIAVTIHDLTIHRFSTARATTRGIPLYRLKRLVYRFVFWLAIKRAKVIFVPTEFVKKDLLGEYPWLDERKIIVTYEGVGEDIGAVEPTERRSPKEKSQTLYSVKSLTLGNSDSVLSRYDVRRPYFLYVGSMYPHKNLPRLVEAFRLVAEEYEDLSLVLVGKRDFFQERLKEEIEGPGNSPRAGRGKESDSSQSEESDSGESAGSFPCQTLGNCRTPRDQQNDRIIFPAFKDPGGYISDEDLAVIYKNALVFVFPSLSEGFGLPLLEAMSFGVPVAASNATCIPEVCGNAPLYFDPKDPKDMARKMESLINNPALRKDLVQKGFENLKRFSWEKMAKKTLAGYRLC